MRFTDDEAAELDAIAAWLLEEQEAASRSDAVRALLRLQMEKRLLPTVEAARHVPRSVAADYWRYGSKRGDAPPWGISESQVLQEDSPAVSTREPAMPVRPVPTVEPARVQVTPAMARSLHGQRSDPKRRRAAMARDRILTLDARQPTERYRAAVVEALGDLDDEELGLVLADLGVANRAATKPNQRAILALAEQWRKNDLENPDRFGVRSSLFRLMDWYRRALTEADDAEAKGLQRQVEALPAQAISGLASLLRGRQTLELTEDKAQALEQFRRAMSGGESP